MTEARPSILVTGGAGYVGSHVCKALAGAGYRPVTYDNLCRGHRWAVKWGPFEEGDLHDTGRLHQVMAQHRPQAVVHMAAFAYVGESVADPLSYYQNNVSGSISLLRAVQAMGIGSFVFSSTCSVYGFPSQMPITEAEPPNPLNPYGASKAMVERLLADAGLAFGLRAICLRYFNAAGADPGGEIGECHDPEPHLIPLVLDVAAKRRESVTIFGDDYPTPDGTCVRDYVHVVDIAAAHVAALDHLLRGGSSAVLNLGGGAGFSVRQVIEVAEAVTGRPIRVEMGPRRAGDPPVLVGDAGRARDILGWQPTRSTLAQQIGDAWNWHRHAPVGGANRG